MRQRNSGQLSLFLPLTGVFPATRYQGSKAKLAGWIWQQISDLPFQTCLDAFGGTGAVAYKLKQAGKSVTYNDLLGCNYQIGCALIENSHVRLSADRVAALLQRQPGISYPTFVQDTFADIYFTDAENAWIDQTITNIRALCDPYQSALAFFALAQACLVKRPYNLFHRKNLYLRLAEVERTFGNKTTWDRPFPDWFTHFIAAANAAVFYSGQPAHAQQGDAQAVTGHYDLVYIDSPYISGQGIAVDYHHFYHFLEGLAHYDTWPAHIDWRSKHRRLQGQPNPWTSKTAIYTAFDRLFARYQASILVVSYRSDGIPSEAELVALLQRYKRQVRVIYSAGYQYALSTNKRSKEVLLIGT